MHNELEIEKLLENMNSKTIVASCDKMRHLKYVSKFLIKIQKECPDLKDEAIKTLNVLLTMD